MFYYGLNGQNKHLIVPLEKKESTMSVYNTIFYSFLFPLNILLKVTFNQSIEKKNKRNTKDTIHSDDVSPLDQKVSP